MPEYEPFELDPKMIEAIKATYNIPTNEEAAQPKIVRKFFDEVVCGAIKLREVEKEDIDIHVNNVSVSISVLRPVGYKDKVLPTVLFFHGGGWIVGSYQSHGIFTNELVNMVPCCVVFVHYSLSPEAKYPVALEECYAALCWIQKNGSSINVNTEKIAVIGDSAGGNLAAALSIFAKERGNTGISSQVLCYPVLDVDFNTESYEQQKDNPIIPRKSMEHAWRLYVDNEEHCKLPTVAPMAAPLDLLKGLPPALIITAEIDVLRSEGEEYSKKLISAGVDTASVRYTGIAHGFLTTPPLGTQAMTGISQIVDFLRKH